MLDIAAIRSNFPILNTRVYGHPLIYLDNAATTQKPQCVIDSISNYYAHTNSNIHRGVHYLSEQASTEYEESRSAVKQFINAKNDIEIIFTKGTTESINLVASCFGQSVIQDDDEIIVSEMEHHSNLIPWQMICTQKKAHLKILPMNDKAELNIQDLDKLISNKTKLISVTYVSNTLGTTNNIKAIIDRAHLDRIPVLIDGAQAVQHLPVDMQELDCDFFVFSGHKMYAGTGIGVLYGKEEWLDKLPPYQVGGGMVNSARLQKASFTSLPLKFEAGTPNIASAISLKKAIEYMSQIGLDSIHIHEQDLYSYLQNSLMEIEGLTIYGPKNNGIGSLSFNIAKCSPYDVGFILDKMGIAVRTGTHCAETVMQHYHIDGTVRVSLGLYNTKEEIDHLLQGIKKAQKMLS